MGGARRDGRGAERVAASAVAHVLDVGSAAAHGVNPQRRRFHKDRPSRYQGTLLLLDGYALPLFGRRITYFSVGMIPVCSPKYATNLAI